MINTAYISRLFPMPPSQAVPAAEAWHRRLTADGTGRRVAAAPRLRLGTHFEPTGCDPLLLRCLSGILWVDAWPVRVVLELVNYSRNACELALRPTSLRWPVASDRYGRAAVEALEEVVRTVQEAGELITREEPEPDRNVGGLVRSMLSAYSVYDPHILGHE